MTFVTTPPGVLDEIADWMCGKEPQPFFVAFDWATPFAILRPKTPSGLAEWLTRRWEYFGGRTPILVDVTQSVAGAVRDLYRDPVYGVDGDRPLWDRLHLLVWSDAPPALAYGAGPSESVVASIPIRSDLYRDVLHAMARHARRCGVVRPRSSLARAAFP